MSYFFLIMTGCAALNALNHLDSHDRIGERIEEEQRLQAQRKPSSIQPSDDDMDRALRLGHIVLGMTHEDVLVSWGEPAEKQTSGNPGAERWIYHRTGTNEAPIVYFENFRVSGWEHAPKKGYTD